MEHDAKQAHEYGLWGHVGLGVKGRCPNCGKAKLFNGYLKVVDRCSVCGLDLSGHDVGDGPVVPLMLVIGGIVVGLALWLELSFEPPVWVHGVIWTPCVVGLVAVMLPMMKGINIALQHRYRSTEDTRD
jgi:uncharacterized protein (DUF983 family)